MAGLFQIKDNEFYLNDQPFKIYSGAMHYFRTLPEYWEDRLLKLKLAGFNTVETYVCWNLHEPQKGVFDFKRIIVPKFHILRKYFLAGCRRIRLLGFLSLEFHIKMKHSQTLA